MRVTVEKNIVTWKLGKELITASIPHYGMSLFGNVLEILLVDENQSAAAQVAINAHDGIDTTAQRQSTAKTTAKNIPNWATWSQQDWAIWRDANVSSTQVNTIGSLADAKAVLLKMAVVLDSLAKLEIAIRNQVWPDLPEG